MARAKKNGTYLNVCIENSIYEQLNEICADAGQTKTIVVERALNSYFCDYREKQRKLKELCCFIISIMFWAIVVFIIIIYVDEEQYIRNQKKIVKKFSISYNEVGNILATENQRAKIIYAIEIK